MEPLSLTLVTIVTYFEHFLYKTTVARQNGELASGEFATWEIVESGEMGWISEPRSSQSCVLPLRYAAEFSVK